MPLVLPVLTWWWNNTSGSAQVHEAVIQVLEDSVRESVQGAGVLMATSSRAHQQKQEQQQQQVCIAELGRVLGKLWGWVAVSPPADLHHDWDNRNEGVKNT